MTTEHHAGCALREKTGDTCTCRPVPLYRVTCIATVRKVYEIEAKDEMEAIETASLNEPDDEIEVYNELCSVEEIKN